MNPGAAASATLWIRTASGIEVLTGITLVTAPSSLARLLFGSGLNAAGEATCRIAGLVMLCLALGCWPRGGDDSGRRQALLPMTALSWLTAAFLVLFGLIGAKVGLLLWPAASLHLILAVLLTRACLA
jgi:hypothetical protein